MCTCISVSSNFCYTQDSEWLLSSLVSQYFWRPLLSEGQEEDSPEEQIFRVVGNILANPFSGITFYLLLFAASISATPRELGDKTWINGYAFYGFASVEDGPVNKAFIGVTKYRAMDARTLKTVLVRCYIQISCCFDLQFVCCCRKCSFWTNFHQIFTGKRWKSVLSVAWRMLAVWIGRGWSCADSNKNFHSLIWSFAG